MNNPFFSVIVPVYNVEKYLRKCVDSILSQSFTDFEVILVDDGSPDNCPKICDEYAEKDTRVKVIHKDNGGVSSARNAGIAAANTEFVVFCDSDDYYLQGAFAKIVDMITNNNADVYCFGTRKELKTGTIDIISKEYIGDITADLLLSLAYAGYVKFDKAAVDVSTVNKVYRKSIINGAKIKFDETMRIAEDILFNATYFAECKTIICLNETLYFYRMNMSSAIHVDRGFAEKGMERSVYFLSNIQKVLEKQIEPDVLYPVAKSRYNRLIIDVGVKRHEAKNNIVQVYRFIKNCCKWYEAYLKTYGVDIAHVRVIGKKAMLEDFMVRNRLIMLICVYTKIIELYHKRKWK